MKQIQATLPTTNPYFTIVQLIQDLALLYYRTLIDTIILTEDEQIKLFEMVNNHTDNKYDGEWKLLFRASRDGLLKDDFCSKCVGIKNTLCIMHSPQNNVFGGFTSLPWQESDGSSYKKYMTDINAFLYLIRSSQGHKSEIFPVQDKGVNAIAYSKKLYLTFGNGGYGMDVVDNGESTKNMKERIRAYATDYYCGEYKLERHHLNGSNQQFHPQEIEVFQLN